MSDGLTDSFVTHSALNPTHPRRQHISIACSMVKFAFLASRSIALNAVSVNSPARLAFLTLRKSFNKTSPIGGVYVFLFVLVGSGLVGSG